MSTTRPTEENFLMNPMFRWAIALSSSAVIAVIAVLFLEGTMQWLVLGIAVLNAVVEPKLLERAAYQDAQ